MQKTISSSCYDAIIIKQANRTYKSIPFQVVFSNSLIKQIQKNKQRGVQPYQLSLQVNDRKIDIPMKIDSTGRVVFEKRFNRKQSMVSDSSDFSDDDYSQKSSTIDSRITKNKKYNERLEQYKNEQAPNRFWQFAWLFNQKKEDQPRVHKIQEEEEMNKINLGKIKEEVYEGQQSCHQPLFHLSLCGNLLKKKESKEQILKIFYQNRVEYSAFIKDPPTFINDSNLVMKLQQSIYTWQLGITILTCRYAYGKELKNEEIEDIIKNKFTKNKLLTFISGPNITKLDIRQYEKDEQKSNDLKKISRHRSLVVKYRKSPDSDKIRKMKLKYGKNVAKFTLDVGMGVTEQIQMKIFLWDHHQKIVISDIDGTITKSDILGQILSKWIHTGIIKLFQEVVKRHYKIIYLTARAIGQYQQTSKFLSTVEQQGVYLPQGPLMMSPDGYYRSFTREVIYKTPDYLKTKILASLNQVFPSHTTPIYCGFGNRETDSNAYLRINISPQRIFNITQKSVLTRQSDPEFASTYSDMLENIDQYFPQFIKDNPMVESSSDSQISQFQAVGLEDSEILKNTKTKSVDADLSQYNLQGIEPNQLAFIGSQSKKRNSQHQICEEDLRALNLGQSNNSQGQYSEQKNENRSLQNEMISSTSQQLKKFASTFELSSNKKDIEGKKQQGQQNTSSFHFEKSEQKLYDDIHEENQKQVTKNDEPLPGESDHKGQKLTENNQNIEEEVLGEVNQQKLLAIEHKLQQQKSEAQLQINETKQEAIDNKQIEETKQIDEKLPAKVL